MRHPAAPQASARKGFTDCVRRRRWVRRKRQDAPAQRQASGGAVSAGDSSRRESIGKKTVLGIVQPGGKLPLPYGFNSSGKQLQVRLGLCVSQLPFNFICSKRLKTGDAVYSAEVQC